MSHVNKRSIVDIKCNYYDNKYIDTVFIPIGLGWASSLNFILNANSTKTRLKGTELGYFSHGGSAIIMLFPYNSINLLQNVNMNIKMGQKLATFKR